jgi:3-phosphoshikimate 1-carboxyvinyltransferase
MKLIRPSEINGVIAAPPSKSLMQRATAAALLTPKRTIIENPSFCNDSLAALEIAEKLGAKINRSTNSIFMKGSIKPADPNLNCYESGLCLRMFSPIATLWNGEVVISGSGTLMKRPVSMMEKPLKELGAEFISKGNKLPLQLKGPLQGGMTRVDGSIGSQFLTGLLLALPRVGKNSQIEVHNLNSKPYINMTIKLLKDFKVKIEHIELKTFFIPGNQTYQIGKYRVEGDWSGAAFLLVAGALGGKVQVRGLKINSEQGDKNILAALDSSGAFIKYDHQKITVEKNQLNAFCFDASDCPDLFPPLVALAIHCRGKSRIKGVKRLYYKESNRALILKKEFFSLGGHIKLDGDWMEVEGKRLSGGTIDSHHDHRIAMAAAVAAIRTPQKVTIKNSVSVSKSYPEFFQDFKKIGGMVYE